MDTLADTHHLSSRNGRWYYRRRVPLNLTAVFGKVVQASLGTSDKKHAIRLREIRDIEWSARFAEAEGLAGDVNPKPVGHVRVLTEPLAQGLVQQYVEQTDRRYGEAWAKGLAASKLTRAKAVEELEFSLALARDRASNYDHEAFISEAVDRVLGSQEFIVDDETYSSEAFCALVRRSLVEVFRRALARAGDNHDNAFFDTLFDPSQSKQTTIVELAEQFISYEAEETHAHQLSTKNLDKTKAEVALLVAILGDSTSVRDVSYDRCREFCSVLAEIPANRTKFYGNLPISDVLVRAKVEERPTLSFISQQQYLATFKRVLDLAVSKDLLRTNPAATLRPLARDRVAAEDKRAPFDIEQLKTFFHSSFYKDCASQSLAPARRADQDWRFWMPFLTLFMGMRPREICQLHVDDLRRTPKGTWFISVEATGEDEEDKAPARKTTKTKASKRHIPLHAEVLRLGFVAFVADQKAASDDPRLFPSIRRTKYGDPAQYPLKRFNESFFKEAMVLKPRQTYYSLRHTWRDAVRVVNPPEDFLQAVGAWNKGKTTSDIYGSPTHPDRYSKIMDQVAFEGLDLSHLYVESALA